MAKKDTDTKGGAAAQTELGASGSTALATPNESAQLAAVLDGIDVGSGGLGELDEADFRLAAKIWNFKGEIDGEPVSPTTFFDTVQESSKKELDLALLDLHKTNLWAEFVDGKMVRRCSSADQAMGIMEDGTERPCKGCPDAEWRQVDGKRTRRCGPVYNVIAMERDTQQPCVLRFKRTSLKAIQSHLQKHHIGKLVIAGRRQNVPLFSLSVKATLKLTGEKNKYAVPVLERGAVLSRDEVLAHAESAKFYRDNILGVMAQVEKIDERTDAGADGAGHGDDSSFEFGANAGGSKGGGDRFVDDADRMR
jgi:hypothetical protein